MSTRFTTAAAHAAQVAKISTAVKAFYAQNTPFRIFHGASNSTRAAARHHIVDISALTHILAVDEENKTALVEPGIAMEALVRALLPLNLAPAVVPEFPGITAGGAFAGTAAESSSFRHGYFDGTVSGVEMVLGDGEVVWASAGERAELFYASAGALGTMGIATLLEVRLVACGPYVEVAYHAVASHAEALQRFGDVGAHVDFVDCIMFSGRGGVVVEGRFVHKREAGVPVVRFTRAADPWFFTHVHRKIRCAPPEGDYMCLTCHWTQHSRASRQDSTAMVELVPVADYFFRYDRGVFWMGAYGWAPKLWNRFTRFLLDGMWRTRFQYRVLHLLGGTPHIIQDLAIPEQNAPSFLAFMHDTFKIYPLWLCPIKHDAAPPMHTARTNTKPTRQVVNIGVWGSPQYGTEFLRGDNFEQFVENNRIIEGKVAEAGGLKWLYACNYYREEEFWSIYDKLRYDRLRVQWKADRLPSLWEKIRRSRQELREVRLFSFLAALLYAWLGVDRLVS